MNQALMQPEMYDRLRQRRDAMELNGVARWSCPGIENLTVVFVLVWLQPRTQHSFTVLVVGQATYGYRLDEAYLKTFEKMSPSALR